MDLFGVILFGSAWLDSVFLAPTLIMCEVLSHLFVCLFVLSIFSEIHSFPSSFRTNDTRLPLL